MEGIYALVNLVIMERIVKLILMNVRCIRRVMIQEPRTALMLSITIHATVTKVFKVRTY